MPKIRMTVTPSALGCPFCGSEDLEVISSMKESEGTPMQIVCCDCAACGPTAVVSDEYKEKIISGEKDGLNLLAAMSHWNVRVTR